MLDKSIESAIDRLTMCDDRVMGVCARLMSNIRHIKANKLSIGGATELVLLKSNALSGSGISEGSSIWREVRSIQSRIIQTLHS